MVRADGMGASRSTVPVKAGPAEVLLAVLRHNGVTCRIARGHPNEFYVEEMFMTNEVMYKAADLLRGIAKDPLETAAFVVAMAVFQATCATQKPAGQERTSEEFRNACLSAADLLVPLCPHCSNFGPAPTVSASETPGHNRT
jgi:hypothetical protein